MFVHLMADGGQADIRHSSMSKQSNNSESSRNNYPNQQQQQQQQQQHLKHALFSHSQNIDTCSFY